MKSYIVVWVDFCGRVRCKNYIYRKCCEKFAVSLCASGNAYGNIQIMTYQQGRRIKCERSLNRGSFVCRL